LLRWSGGVSNPNGGGVYGGLLPATLQGSRRHAADRAEDRDTGIPVQWRRRAARTRLHGNDSSATGVSSNGRFLKDADEVALLAPKHSLVSMQTIDCAQYPEYPPFGSVWNSTCIGTER